MNIRTKLALALVSASLLSMAALGYFAYVSSERLLGEISQRQLDALAESKTGDLAKVIDGWRESVRLIRSRTRIRQALQAYALEPDPAVRAELTRIAHEIQGSSRSILRLSLLGLDGSPLALAGDSVEPPRARPGDGDDVAFAGIRIETNGRLGVVFRSSIVLDGQRVGSVETVFRAAAVRALTDNFTGLGETGEAYVVTTSAPDRFMLLNRLRHDSGDVLRSGPLAHAPAAAAAALAGHDAALAQQVTDYRGQQVIAATRSLPELGLALVVKIDEAEEDKRAEQLLDMMLDLGLSIGALTILGGTLLGFRLAQPIRQLSHIVDMARRGDSDLRAPVKGDDEVASLSRSVNELLDQTSQLREHKPKE